jgi:hypothetical protein
MQVTAPIGDYAKHFVALAHEWAAPRDVPLLVYGALPGCNDTHPTPNGRDPRFAKVWLLAHAMRAALAASNSGRGRQSEARNFVLARLRNLLNPPEL